MQFLPEAGDLEDLGIITQLFMMFSYGFILFQAANMIGDGSEMLLLLYGPGIIGGLVIPILGAVPDGAIILFSGIGGGTQEELQKEIAVGVGTLAGSTIMLLTIPFFFVVYLGIRDIDPETGKAAFRERNGKRIPKYTNGFSWMNSGITVDASINFSAKMAIITSLCYLIIQIPALIWYNLPKDQKEEKEHIPALVGLIITVIAFVGYSWLQIMSAAAQEQQTAHEERVRFQQWQKTIQSKFSSTDRIVKTIFEKFDTSGDGKIDRGELQAGLKELGLNADRGQIVQMLGEADGDADALLNFDEFRLLVKTWTSGSMSKMSKDVLDEVNNGTPTPPAAGSSLNTTNIEISGESHHHAISEQERHLLELFAQDAMDEDEDEEEEEELLELSDNAVLMRALGWLLLGTLLVTVFSDPMCACINAFATSSGIPAFYISFVVTPLASNASEVIAAIMFAKKKTQQCVTLSLASLYGAACMNSTFCLGIFFALIYIQELTWTFTAETVAIMVTIFVVGVFGLKSDTFLMWEAGVILSMYVISLILVIVLNPFDE